MSTGTSDWAAIRRGREVDGKNWSELALLHRISRNRITRRAKRERWRDPGEITRKANEDFARRLVAREGETVLESLRQTLALTDRIQNLVARHLGALEGADAPDIEALKSAAEVVRKTHAVQSEIAGLRVDQQWRVRLEGDAKDSASAVSEAIQRALDELCGEDE